MIRPGNDPIKKLVTVHGSDKPTDKSPVTPATPGGPARILLPVNDESDRGGNPVLRDKLAVVVLTGTYPCEHLQKLIGALALLLALSSLSARAQVARLAELEESALRHAPAISVSQARVGQADARLDRAQDAYHPTFSLDVTGSLAPGQKLIELEDIDGNRYWGSGSKALGQSSSAFVPQPRYGILLGLRENLYDFGRRSAAVEAASADRLALQADTHATERGVRRAVRAAYLRWATAHALWTLAQESARAAEQREKRVLALIHEGVRPQADSTAAAARSAQAAIDAERAAADLEAARIDLGFTAHRDLTPEAQPEPALLAGQARSVQGGPQADPTIAALVAQRRAAEANARMYGSASSPVLAASVNAGVEGRMANVDNDVVARVFPVYAVGLSFSFPLWDGGISSAQSDEARAKAVELEALASARRDAQLHGSKRTDAAKAHATRRIDLAKRWVMLGESRLRELEASEDLSANGVENLAAAQVELARARLELVLAQSARAEANLGLLEP
jgi:outer membrane protein TolC